MARLPMFDLARLGGETRAAEAGAGLVAPGVSVLRYEAHRHAGTDAELARRDQELESQDYRRGAGLN